MSKVKNVVKVMNIHSLLRVDKSRKTADKFLATEKELTLLIDQIFFNENLNLDKKIIKPNENGTILNIYIGNDLGFCGNFNSSVSHYLKKDDYSEKIVIGRKINYPEEKCLLKIDKEDFRDYINKIESIIYNLLHDKKCKEINVIYNHYHNINEFEFKKAQLFPVELVSDDIASNDFVIESNINDIFIKIITLYICYEIEMLEQNSFAAENIMRQKITDESLRKIDEREAEAKMEERKQKNYEKFKKQLEDLRYIEKGE